MLLPQQRMFAFVSLCVIIFVASACGAIVFGPVWGLILPAPLLTLAFLLRRMFLPGFSGQTRVRLASLSIIYGASALYFAPSNPVSTFVVDILSELVKPLGLGPFQDPLGFNLGACPRNNLSGFSGHSCHTEDVRR